MKRHPVVVVASEEGRLGDLLARLGEGADRALREGRVFIGTRRAAGDGDRVAAGDEVTMYPARDANGSAPRILMRAGGIVAAFKPAHMATIPDHHGSAGTLRDEVAALVGVPADRLSVTSRLDVGVSGVVLFATDAPARERLTEARRQGRYLRHYIAIASRAPVPDRGVWEVPIGRDRDPRKRRAHGPVAVPAVTAYAVRAVADRAALLAVEPKSGRTHQIRVHAAHAGCALYGDPTYGGPAKMVSSTGSVTALGRIALHAAWVEVPGEKGEALRVEAQLPEDFAAIWVACGGVASELERALPPLTPE